MTATAQTFAQSDPPKIGRQHPTSLRSRLTRLFLATAVVLAAIVTVSTLSFLHLVSARHTLLNQIDPASLSADKLLLAYVDQETGVRGYILSHNQDFLQPAVQGVEEQQGAERALSRELAGQTSLMNLVAATERQAAIWQKEFARPAVVATEAGSMLYASERALEASKTLFDRIRTRFDTLDRALGASRSSAGHDLTVATAELVAVLSIGLVALAAAGIILRRAVNRHIAIPLLSLGADARLVASGQLSHAIEPAGPSEILALGGDIELMRQRILDELAEVASARSDLDQRNEELARSNGELEQFAYVASHDLQEPLRKVTSFVQLLEERYVDELDDRAHLYIDHAVDGAKRMQQLISDLLAFSRVGRSDARLVEVPMSEVVEAALDNLEPAIDEVGVTIDLAGSLPSVLGDRTLLTSLWQNLIGNSVKFHGSDPLVIAIAWRPVGDDYEFAVSDNGIGIDQRFAEKVFVIFQRLHGREAYEGTGIGLALCRKIVEFHGGRIWLDPAHQVGTRICFTLPRSLAAPRRHGD